MITCYELSPVYDSRKSFYGKARVVVVSDGEKILISYTTPVCRAKDGKLERIWYGSSATTSRHIREFCRQMGLEEEYRRVYGGNI